MFVLTKKSRSKVAAKKLELRDRLWPNLDKKLLWHRSEKVGFVTIPRALPLVMTIMDDMANNRPLSATYLDLWCHSWDDSFVGVTKPREHAFAAGFNGQRAEASWTAHMRLLEAFGFIQAKPGVSGAFNYALLLNPIPVLFQHRQAKTAGIREDAWNALQQRLIDVGAKDLDEFMVDSAVTVETGIAG